MSDGRLADPGRLRGLIGAVVDPCVGETLAALGSVRGVQVGAAQVDVELVLEYAGLGTAPDLVAAVEAAAAPELGGRRIAVTVRVDVRSSNPGPGKPGIRGVKNIIAVASGKGGVGKSTTAVNLALALSAEGAGVGLLDADIYGPSQGLMLGVAPGQRPGVRDGKWFEPIRTHGLQAMSMSFLVDEREPMVWRGPMVTGALQQLLTQTDWQDIDYLVVDMPPGTGDIQLTMAQKVPVTGAVIVTTPQDIALLDARKGIEMFRKVSVPVLGVVENMSIHICSACGHAEHLFGAGGGERIAEEYDTVLLGALPLALEIREQTDAGRPTVISAPDSPLAQVYRTIARATAVELFRRQRATDARGPRISIVED